MAKKGIFFFFFLEKSVGAYFDHMIEDSLISSDQIC